jgi:hypothetical protein
MLLLDKGKMYIKYNYTRLQATVVRDYFTSNCTISGLARVERSPKSVSP